MRPANKVDYLRALCRTVPLHIVECVGRQGAATSGLDTTRDGSMVFIDLVGFTTLCERLATSYADGLSRLSNALDQLFADVLERAIFGYAGNVVQFGGDSISICFFGEDHARRAAAASLQAQEVVGGDSGRLLGGDEPLSSRIGVTSGELTILVAGDTERRGVVLSGSTARRAVVLQELAEPGTVLADADFVARLGGGAEVARLAGDHRRLLSLDPLPARTERDIDRIIEPEVATDEKIFLLEPFVPKPLAERLRTTPSGWRLSPELRRAVIVFSELWGLLPDQNDRELGKVLSRSLARSFRKYGGFLAKANIAPRGHRIMTVFGAINPTENDAERALLATLEATARVRAFTAGSESAVRMRSGVHTGDVYFGPIGSDNRHDLTAIGDTVNVAARAAAAAGPFEVIATGEVIAEVGELFLASARGPIPLKGKKEPMPLHVVHAPSEPTARYLRVRTQQRFCAGRESEWKALEAAADSTEEGRGMMIGLCGDEGTGKSFLLAPLIDRWVTAGRTAIMGRCRFSHRGEPLAPLVAMLSTYFGLTSSDDEFQAGAAIHAGLHRLGLGEYVAEISTMLRPVLRPDGTSEASLELTDTEARERLLGAMLRFVELRAQTEPLMYILEDIHFADSLSLELTARLASIASRFPMLIVMTYRDAPQVARLRRLVHQELALGVLDEAAATELVCHELRCEEVHPALATFLFERSQRNPAYLVELVRFLNSSDLIALRGSMAYARGPSAELLEDAVPNSIAKLTLSRLDHLSAVERTVLRAASTIGGRLEQRLIAESLVAEVDAETVGVALERLMEERLIVSESAHGDHLVFRDDATRAVAYSTITAAERRAMHARVADALERRPSHDPTRSPGVLALHRERAGELPVAVGWYELAGRAAADAGLDAEAVDLLEHWSKLAEALPTPEQPTAELRAEIGLLQVVTHGRLGRAREALAIGRGIQRDYSGQLDGESLNVLDYWLGDALLSLGQPQDARVRFDRVVEGSAGTRLRSDAALGIARIHELAYEWEAAQRWLDEAATLAGDDAYRQTRIVLRRANVVGDRGELERCRTMYIEAHERASVEGWTALDDIAVFNLAYTEMVLDNLEEALATFEAGVQRRNVVGDTRGDAHDLASIGQTMVWLGRYDDAGAYLEKALSLGEEMGDQQILCESLAHLGLAIGMTSDHERGTAMCAKGREQAQASGLREAALSADLHLLRLAVVGADAVGFRESLDRCRQAQAEIARFPLFVRVLDSCVRDAREQGLVSGDEA